MLLSVCLRLAAFLLQLFFIRGLRGSLSIVCRIGVSWIGMRALSESPKSNVVYLRLSSFCLVFFKTVFGLLPGPYLHFSPLVEVLLWAHEERTWVYSPYVFEPHKIQLGK